jgi:hypothetical protein
MHTCDCWPGSMRPQEGRRQCCRPHQGRRTVDSHVKPRSLHPVFLFPLGQDMMSLMAREFVSACWT